MNYVPSDACRATARAASGPSLTEQEITAAFQRVADYKARLEAEGKSTGMEERLRRFAEQEAERTRIAAAMQRRHAALNIVIRDRQEAAIAAMIAQGLHPKKALLAILEGTQGGVTGGRKSVHATKQAYEARYLGSVVADLEKQAPHLIGVLADTRLDADIMAEMMEMKPGGKPGVTGNKDALIVAKIFAKAAERARVDLNKLGASIGKLDGWAGPQMHNDLRMLEAGKDKWVGFIVTKLDLDRTFSEGWEPDQVNEMLGDIYDTIITGLSNKPTAASKGQRVNPANLAKTLGASRVLHFKDAANARAYQDEYGVGNTFTGMIAHLRRSAHVAAAMETLGPNPQIMFDGLADSLKRRIKADPKIAAKDKAEWVDAIDTQSASFRTAMDIALGLNSRPENVTFAKIGQDIRAVASMSKLGGATLTSIPSDTMTTAMASMFRGNNVIAAFYNQIAGVLQGRPKGEAAEISYLLGEGFDAILGYMSNPYAALDGPIGRLAGLQQAFFKWNGLAWWTDVSRSVAGRTIAAEMGMRAKSAFKDLPDRYRDLLGRHGIDAVKWDAIRSAKLRNANGKDYVTPDRIAEIDDAMIEPIVAKRLAAARKASRVDEAKSQAVKDERMADYMARRESILDDGRRELELDVLRFVADETSYSVIETDAKSQRIMQWNQTVRPGTFAGEAIRMVMQFKGFPIAFVERSLGRMTVGQRKGISKGEHAAHIGTFLAGMIMAGYAAMVAKDTLKGHWPPRDPADWRTWMAALQQGGALGIYGDFLFSKVNRFGGGIVETLLGPTVGTVGDLVNTGLDARDFALSLGNDEFAGAAAFSTGTGLIPFGNVFYVKPALDLLILDSLREALSPGYLRRQMRNREREYGQQRLLPTPLDPLNVAGAF
jgi:hypothetical protein